MTSVTQQPHVHSWPPERTLRSHGVAILAGSMCGGGWPSLRRPTRGIAEDLVQGPCWRLLAIAPTPCLQEKLKRDFFGSLGAPGAKAGGAATAAAPAVASPRTKRAGGYFGTSSVHISHEPTVAAMVAEQRKTHFELAGPVPASEADKTRFARGPATAPSPVVARPSALGVDRSRVHLVSHFAISEMAAAAGAGTSGAAPTAPAAAGRATSGTGSVTSSRRPSAAVAASDAPYAAKAAAAQSRKAVRAQPLHRQLQSSGARLAHPPRLPVPRHHDDPWWRLP